MSKQNSGWLQWTRHNEKNCGTNNSFFLTFILELLDASGFSLFSLGRIDKDENDFLDSPVEASHILLCVRTIGIKPIEPPIGDDDDMHKLIFRGSCHFEILSGRLGCENSRTTHGQILVHPYISKSNSTTTNKKATSCVEHNQRLPPTAHVFFGCKAIVI